ncbi:hypothetical protein JVX92_01985 [Microbacterium hominis]|uniref:hypothetical protein n=1 Tax=Microbacterium hominis TaxID=162426 RepID=UPI0019639C90|nr:hypothetical protein [Microbacterium hominis]QRY41078.1 hypothetical protein JVX92_01985 [Microbacterium hominis]
MHRYSNRIAAAFACTVLCGVLAAGSTSASASDSAPLGDDAATPSVRVVDRTNESAPAATRAPLMGDAVSPPVSVKGVIPVPPEINLRVGESVQVNYSDGVVVHQALAAGCTSSSAVSNPYVASGYAWSDHSHSLSSGCPNSTSVNGILSSFAWPLWHQRHFYTVTVTPGTSVYWSPRKQCQNNGSTTWHAENAIGSSTTALSADVNLACNPG